MDESEGLIFLTDKYGKHNKTKEIESISFDIVGKFWHVEFKNHDREFHYKKENVQIIRNCLKDKQSATVFDYLLQMAEFSEIKNGEGQNLLVKNLEKTRFINAQSVLAKYLNSNVTQKSEKPECDFLIFPFGCNNSQYKAVQTAMNNQVSIIQGPPGTGKTQTILNIIANLLVQDKTVLVVSNNNAATANIYEKLASMKYMLDFICATIGKKENINTFLAKQQKVYPDYLAHWRNSPIMFSAIIKEEVKQLGKYFQTQERIAEINSELSSLSLEFKYFGKNNKREGYKNKKLSKFSSTELMDLTQKLTFIYSEKEKFSFFKKLNLKLKYGLGKCKFWKTDEEQVLYTLKAFYYPQRKSELEKELQDNNEYLKTVNPDTIYEDCLNVLRKHIADKYKNYLRRFFENGKDIYFHPADFTDEYPVVLSTTFSSRATLGASPEFLYDYVIMDEASQVDVVTGALALSCAKNAVIVGDKKQLPNVIEESKKTIVQDIFSKTRLPQGYSFLNSFLQSLEMILPATPQTLLREHYRCNPKIIEFCNQQFYGGKLLIMTKDKGEENVLQAVKTIPGNFCKNRYNQRQIDVIRNDILPTFTDEEKQSLGIIAPYNNQTDAIKSQIPEIDTATVHKYQGREKDNIIISTVDNEITAFADDPNMLNVAISRAKKRLSLVISGNPQPENSNLVALLKYIEHNNFTIQESKVNSIFDFLYSKAGRAKFKYLNESKKISKFDSENAMNNLLTKIFEEDKYLKFYFVFEMPLKEIVNSHYMSELPQELSDYANRSWSHVDFTVFNRVTKEILFGIEVDGYRYHKRGTVQSNRDKMKDQVFELIGLPLLRCSTKGSEEERRIREELDKYL